MKLEHRWELFADNEETARQLAVLHFQDYFKLVGGSRAIVELTLLAETHDDVNIELIPNTDNQIDKRSWTVLPEPKVVYKDDEDEIYIHRSGMIDVDPRIPLYKQK